MAVTIYKYGLSHEISFVTKKDIPKIPTEIKTMSENEQKRTTDPYDSWHGNRFRFSHDSSSRCT